MKGLYIFFFLKEPYKLQAFNSFRN